MARMNHPGWRLCAMNDKTGRRGIWYRVPPTQDVTPGGPITQLEVCAGREGDDCYVELKVGQVLTREDLYQLMDCLRTGAWMVESYPPPKDDDDE
jgi:hypothetical protein